MVYSWLLITRQRLHLIGPIKIANVAKDENDLWALGFDRSCLDSISHYR